MFFLFPDKHSYKKECRITGAGRPIAPTIGQAASIVGRQKRVHGQPLSHILYANAATV
ncbi:MAG: hypothetical protein IKZ37_06240 [Bacteroidaceae bacterium]|nr:hypothetical protein [Bacteroidaceae bacterium]